MTIHPPFPMIASHRVTVVASNRLVVSGLRHTCRWLARLGIPGQPLVAEASWVEPGQPLLVLDGDHPDRAIDPARRHLGHYCGLATAAAHLVQAARHVRPDAEVMVVHGRRAPGPVAARAVLDGGAIPGSGLFQVAVRSDHFRPVGDPAGILRARALAQVGHPAILVAVRPEDVDGAACDVADLFVLDGFSPAQVREVRNRTFGRVPALDLAAMGDFTPAAAADYVEAGARLLIRTSLPFAAVELVFRHHR